jgi:light-regulated signal transduction histidine kinase (bacteriophytochrome)
LTGRHGFYVTYEAFAMISASMTVQHVKWLEEAGRLSWREPIASFNILLTSSQGDLFQVFGDRRGSDRSGLGLGLSIARKAVRAHGGEIRIRNMPGKGCVFIIEVPLATEESVPEAVV